MHKRILWGALLALIAKMGLSANEKLDHSKDKIELTAKTYGRVLEHEVHVKIYKRRNNTLVAEVESVEENKGKKKRTHLLTVKGVKGPKRNGMNISYVSKENNFSLTYDHTNRDGEGYRTYLDFTLGNRHYHRAGSSLKTEKAIPFPNARSRENASKRFTGGKSEEWWSRKQELSRPLRISDLDSNCLKVLKE